MDKEREYIEHKKKTIRNIINQYNSQYDASQQFKIEEENLNIEDFCTPKYCRGCGKCCKKFPCVYSPNDFLDITDLDYMRAILNTGVVAIVNYNNVFPFIIRNRGMNDSNNIACEDIDYDNPCLLHTESGCRLPNIYRASNGLLYIRKKEKHISLYGKQYPGFFDEYKNSAYQLALGILFDEYKNVAIPQEKVEEENIHQFMKSLIRK